MYDPELNHSYLALANHYALAILPARVRTPRDYRQKSGATVLVVSHSMDDAARYCERLIVFDHGTIRMDGTPEQVFGRTEELMEIGLNVPKATELARALKARGVLSDDAVYTHEQLVAAILRAGGEAAC